MTFADLGLGPEILKAVEEAGYQRPTPIQEQAIPVILMGRDVLGVAQTGTGKTAGFTLPMIEILAGSRAKARMPRSLILAPTRELASQAADNFEIYGKYHRLTMAKLIGGESFVDQEKLLDRGVDVLIATPGRLLDLFDRGRILLNDVKVLVIDEADRMLDMGFIPDVERIVSLLPKMRQTLFFSATMAPEIRRLADAFLMNPKEISVSPQSSAATTVEQFLVVCDELDKREALRHLLRKEDVRNALIFCNRKRDVDILYRSLSKHGFDAVHLHGDMVQSARTETLERFKAGDSRVMVCSDVAARGIDISDLSHVFNFDVPHHSEDYIHRIGRTGRAGKKGRAFTIATPDDGKAVAAIVQLTGQDIPRMSINGLPEMELDMESDGRRRGGKGRDSRGKSRDRKPHRKAETPVVEVGAAEVQTPSREEGRREEVRRQKDPSQRSDSARSGRDAMRGDRNDRYRDRGRRYRDDPEIGEMTQPDNVIGFGDAIPDFMTRAVPLPLPSDKAEVSDTGDEDLAPATMEPIQAGATGDAAAKGRKTSRSRKAAAGNGEAATKDTAPETASKAAEPEKARKPSRKRKAATGAAAVETPVRTDGQPVVPADVHHPAEPSVLPVSGQDVPREDIAAPEVIAEDAAKEIATGAAAGTTDEAPVTPPAKAPRRTKSPATGRTAARKAPAKTTTAAKKSTAGKTKASAMTADTAVQPEPAADVTGEPAPKKAPAKKAVTKKAVAKKAPTKRSPSRKAAAAEDTATGGSAGDAPAKAKPARRRAQAKPKTADQAPALPPDEDQDA